MGSDCDRREPGIGGACSAPALVAAQIGAWSRIAVAVGLAMLIALNFAEAGGRFDGTGTPISTPGRRLADFRASKSAGCCGSRAYELVVGGERPRAALALLAVARGWCTARRADLSGHPHDRHHQHPRHQKVRSSSTR